MDFLELAWSRRSIRSFTQKEVPQESIVTLLETARSAPSAGNCQPWHFFVIRDKGMQGEIESATGGRQPFISGAPVVLVVCADIPKSVGRYGGRGESLYCIQDTAAAIQNILLCAKSLGLGTCWCGAFDEGEISKILHLSEELRPVAIIPVGYPANEPPIAPRRRALGDIVTYIGGNPGSIDSASAEEAPRRIEHCNMGGVVFDDVNLGNSKFGNINFHRVEITDTNLANGRIYECNLSNFAIQDCQLNGMTINGKDVCALLGE